MEPGNNSDCSKLNGKTHRQSKRCGRRAFLKGAAKVAALGSAAMLTGCGTGLLGSKEALSLRWQEYFKKNYRLMTPEEKKETVGRLERLAKRPK